MGCSACMYVSEPRVCLVTVEARRGIPLESDPLELDLQRVMSYLLDAETPTQVPL